MGAPGANARGLQANKGNPTNSSERQAAHCRCLPLPDVSPPWAEHEAPGFLLRGDTFYSKYLVYCLHILSNTLKCREELPEFPGHANRALCWKHRAKTMSQSVPALQVRVPLDPWGGGGGRSQWSSGQLRKTLPECCLLKPTGFPNASQGN